MAGSGCTADRRSGCAPGNCSCNLRPGPVSWWQLLLRFLVAVPSGLLFGLGYLWILVDRKHLSWHDRYSETTVVQLKQNPHRRKT